MFLSRITTNICMSELTYQCIYNVQYASHHVRLCSPVFTARRHYIRSTDTSVANTVLLCVNIHYNISSAAFFAYLAMVSEKMSRDFLPTTYYYVKNTLINLEHYVCTSQQGFILRGMLGSPLPRSLFIVYGLSSNG